jgi:acyl carrier protein
MENDTLLACGGTTTPRTPRTGIDAGLRQRVLDSITALLPGVLGRELPELAEGTTLMAELGMRSANMLELLLGLEDDLDIEIDVEDIDEAGMRSVGDLADYVAGHTITDG